jgi:hypothetical protein
MPRKPTTASASGQNALFADQEIEAPAAKKPAARSALAKVERMPSAEPPMAAQQNLLQSLFQAISNPRIQPEKLHALLDARDRLLKEYAHVEFMTAYIAMQDGMPRISKDGKLEQGVGRSSGRKGASARYSTYENINAVTKPILSKHKFGMLLLPDVGPEGHGIIMRGQLGYVCDTPYGRFVHVERCSIMVPADPTGSKNAPQAVGSGLAYGKRYGAIALLNLVSEAAQDADTDAIVRSTNAAAQDDGRLDEKELKQLRSAIDGCKVDEQVFLAKYKIARIEDLNPRLLREALDACQSFKNRWSAANKEAT